MELLLGEPQFSLALTHPIENGLTKNSNSKSIVEQIMNDGFLWGVQKHRRSIECRLRRKLGDPRWAPHGAKLLVPKTNLIICDSCGHHYEADKLCAYCYELIKKETGILQKEMMEKLRGKPIETEIEFRYKNDSHDSPHPTKRIIEIERERPAWFSKNLLAKIGSNKWSQSNDVIVNEDKTKIKE